FCTPAWSTASRGLWQHGPTILLFATALLLLVRAEDRPGRAALAAIPLGLALAVRPTNLFPSLILTAYVAVRHRGELLRWVAFGGLAIAAVAAVHLATYGLLVPPYYLPSNQPIAPWSDLGAIALAQLASPN